VAPPARSADPTNDLPPELTSFVGRRGELAEVRRLLSQSRLVTLTGFGGIGKTRLARRLAAELRRAYPDGVWFAALGDLTDGALLAESIAGDLRLRSHAQRTARQSLVEFLRNQSVLLVLDNCEHLIEPCAALVDELLRTCPRLHIMTTSREPLRLDGETIHVVSSLSFPGVFDDSTPLTEFEAVRLFVDRARSVVPDFDITPDNREAIVGICRQLDGIPLALELAAVRLRAMSATDLLERLTDQWQLLDMGSRGAPARQRTMEACIGWSYELCSVEEREVWARLAVFSGGFELNAAEVVCADDDSPIGREQVTRSVLSLVQKAILIRSGEAGHLRYRMLEPVRHHAENRLGEMGQLATIRRRHRDWCADLVTRAQREWMSDRQITWMRQLRREHSNLQAALDFCIAEPGESGAGLDIAASLQPFYAADGMFRQGRYWLDRLLAGPTEPTMLRLRAVHADIWLTALDGDLDAAHAWLREGEELAADLGEPAVSLITQAAGLHALCSGDLDRAVSLFERVLDGFQSGPDQTERAHTLAMLGLAYTFLGDSERAFACHRECLAITEPVGESWFRSNSLWHVGIAAWRVGDIEAALQMERESLRLRRLTDDQLGIALCVEALAWIAAVDDPTLAAALLGAASALWKVMDTSTALLPGVSALHESCVDQVRSVLGDAYTGWFDSGARLDRTSAVSFALGEPAPHSTDERASVSQGRAVLTRREREIATLVAQGLSNKEIADRLVIARRTAETHVENILSKLGFTSRVQIAMWTSEQSTEGHVGVGHD